MELRILDLDGGVIAQEKIASRPDAVVHDLRAWGPRIRMACGFRSFARFEADLTETLGSRLDTRPGLTLYGSGDFHHVSLALLRRLTEPVNLLVIDKHPDWMRGIPLMHCGTWLYHAGRMPNVRTIFHVGGDLDFDNSYRPLAPWPWLRSGKVRVIPAIRRFRGGGWNRIAVDPLRVEPQIPVDPARLAKLIEPHHRELSARPLYVSIDKDALQATEAVVNWDSGFLDLDELERVLSGFLAAAERKLAGADSTGDWSPVDVQGVLRRFLHVTEHPWLDVTTSTTVETNTRVNLSLVQLLGSRNRK
ncbi:MAG: hypothetical protein P4L85_26415 [Paludisphaera borealis]|uniref:hypothetical protein n=1 Tax=Paludisphaera borealis TaxID=1387353 RepID=UPI0028511F44|nr:hypothetical protein [Paludisphaera borealis]MDR3622916.1 hypothetical protein [Paludisphaera borealis]